MLEVFSSEGWLTHRIPFRGYSPVFLSLGKGNKIYIGDWDTFTVVRFKALSLE